jgi:peptide/nickel transport system permease protein
MNRVATLALACLAVLVAACFGGVPLAAHFGWQADALDLHHVHEGPGPHHWLGTDELGRDLLLRLLEGGRVSLTVGLAAAAASAVIGAIVGLVAGTGGRLADSALTSLTNGVLALPILPVLIVLSAIDMTKLGVPASIATAPPFILLRIVVIVSLFGWTVAARLVRAETLSVRTRDYVRAARALGVRPTRIALRHILPNVLSPLLVAATLSVGSMILTESILSFLGLGIQPPEASWGNMLTNAQETIYDDPRLAIWPGMMIFVTVICCNFAGDGLRTVLDPRRHSRQG